LRERETRFAHRLFIPSPLLITPTTFKMQRTHRVTRQLLKTASISRPTFLVATCHLISSSSSPLVSPRSISTSRPLSYPLKSTKTSYTSCPSCSTPLPSPLVSPFCSNCSSLLPPSSTPPTAFQLFSLPQQYLIDSKELKKSFLKLQQAVHPDRFGGEGDLKEEWAKTWSSRVNDAYKLLLNPLERGEYLVSLPPNLSTVKRREGLELIVKKSLK